MENICERLSGLGSEDVEAALVREWGAGQPLTVHPTEENYPGAVSQYFINQEWKEIRLVNNNNNFAFQI